MSALSAGALIVDDDARRDEVLRQAGNGLDYIDVAADRRTLTVAFFGPPPDSIAAANFRIDGGVRGRDLRVLSVRRTGAADPELETCVTLRVDRPGDAAVYTLQVVGLPSVDERYAALDFRFNDPGGGVEWDCQAPEEGDAPAGPRPDIDYLAKDYASFRRLLLDRAALVVPGWTERHLPDINVTLLELLAYTGDRLSYYQDAVATEAYLSTARKRISVRRHARLVDYVMHEGCNARAWIALETSHDCGPIAPRDVAFSTAPPGTDFAAGAVFEPVGRAALAFYRAHNAIELYGWGSRSCRLPAGATSATLADRFEAAVDDAGNPVRALDALAAGDHLLFEERLGGQTGALADADLAHRHVVRLTHVRRGLDPLYDAPIIDVGWDAADALPWDVAVRAIDRTDPAGAPLAPWIARANVVLADHGRTLPVVEALPDIPATGARPYQPRLARAGLTYCDPIAPRATAAAAFVRAPRAAVPQISELQTTDPGGRVRRWEPRSDLLASGPADTHFVVEIDDDGAAQLRFGDGRNGRLPEPGARVQVTYRIGTGPAGNVGPDTLTRIRLAEPIAGVTLAARNPLPAAGGLAAESIDDVRTLAPTAFRAEPARAVVAADYAAIAARDPRLQNAAAVMRWTGSRTVIRVAIDPRGTDTIDPLLVADIAALLEPYRRIGHDLEVVGATYVPLVLDLTIGVRDGFERAHVKRALLAALGDAPLPDGTLGFFHPDNRTFGETIDASGIVACAMSVTGVASADVTALGALFAPTRRLTAAGTFGLGPLEIARLDNAAERPEYGVLTLTLRGGR